MISANHNKKNCLRLLSALLLLTAIPMVSYAGGDCTPADPTDVEPVPIQDGAGPAAGQGGELPAGRWELVEARYSTDFPVSIAGTAQGVFELEPDSPFAGWGKVALHLHLTAPVADEIELEGAGTYTAAGPTLQFDNACGDENPADGAEYTVTELDPGFELTLWTQFEYDVEGFPVTINVEARFLLEGEPLLPVLDVTPETLDFGTVEAGNSAATQTVILTSAGTGPVEVTAIAEPGAPFSRTGGDCPGTPFSLEPDQSCTLEYGFAPAKSGIFEDLIVITSDAEPANIEISLSGAAIPPENELFDDRFE